MLPHYEACSSGRCDKDFNEVIFTKGFEAAGFLRLDVAEGICITMVTSKRITNVSY